MVKKTVLFTIMAAIAITILVAANVEQTTKKEEIANDNDQLTKIVHMVYVTPNGKKYHLKTCRILDNSSVVDEIILEDAISKGYEPCKACQPLLKEKKDLNKLIEYCRTTITIS
ncbi:hypothetical protein [uncultured Sphaerochaeta sp.]|uniref:hypothetical protein n=1 Tax=uncultured Sphaerochaeta sp. TaxID=886478 RepID=UPI002AA8CACC|nr:hypothetical protein [uncultured Sphaerochaeta sp.]